MITWDTTHSHFETLLRNHLESTEAWLAKNTPHSEVEELGQHLMFWEFPDKFNAMLESFLKRLR